MGKVMRPTLPALVALLVAMTAVAVGAPVSLPVATHTGGQVGPGTATPARQELATKSIQSIQNTSNYLSLSGETRATARFGNASLDVAGTVEMDNSQLRTEFDETTTIEAFRAADNASSRTAVVERTVDRIQNRTNALEDRQQRAITAYNRGELSTEAFLQRLAIIDADGRQLQTYIESVLRVTGRTPGYSLPNSLRTRLESLKAGPVVMQGSIRARVGRSLSGEREPFSVYVETTDEGIVLARLTSNRYVREAFLGSDYQQPGPDEFSGGNVTAAYERAKKLYPWTFSHSITVPSATGYGSTSIYQMSVDHTQGRLVSYIDGTTTNTFRESQEKRLPRLPITGRATNSTETLRIEADLTHESGPLNVSVRDPETGTPVDARVRLNGQFVGQTGTDGRLWTIRPHGPVTINATTAGSQSVTLDLD